MDFQGFASEVFKTGFLLTWQIEECVQNVKAISVSSLDEFVRILFPGLWPNTHTVNCEAHFIFNSFDS